MWRYTTKGSFANPPWLQTVFIGRNIPISSSYHRWSRYQNFDSPYHFPQTHCLIFVADDDKPSVDPLIVIEIDWLPGQPSMTL